MKILILGGCHTYAFGVEKMEDGYFQTVLQSLKRVNENITVVAYAPITIKNALNLIVSKQIELDSFDLILLQFGNHEFELGAAEFHQLFALKYMRKYDISGSKFTKQLTPELIQERRNWYKSDTNGRFVKGLKKINSLLLGGLFWLIDSVIKYPRFVWYEKLIGDFFRSVEPYKSKVICLGVFPCLYYFRQSLRVKGNSILEKEASLYDIKFIELVNANLDGSYFLPDEVHLNEKGHKYVFERLENVLDIKSHTKQVL